MEKKVRQLGSWALEPSRPSPARIFCYQSAVWGQAWPTGDTYGFWWHDVILTLQAFAWQPSALKKIKWAHLGGFWPVWTLSVHCWHELYLSPACTAPWGHVASEHAVKTHFEGFVPCCLEPVCPYHVNKSGSNYNRTLFSTQSCCHGAERSHWHAFTLCFSAWQIVEVRIQHCV